MCCTITARQQATSAVKCAAQLHCLMYSSTTLSQPARPAVLCTAQPLSVSKQDQLLTVLHNHFQSEQARPAVICLFYLPVFWLTLPLHHLPPILSSCCTPPVTHLLNLLPACTTVVCTVTQMLLTRQCWERIDLRWVPATCFVHPNFQHTWIHTHGILRVAWFY